MTMLVINPGAGPVAAATRENAAENMRQFAEDCTAIYDLLPNGLFSDDPSTKRTTTSFADLPDEHEPDGRFTFSLTRKDCKGRDIVHKILMPGLPLDDVRYLGEPQDIWDYPRLYVDRSSWVWKYAVHVICSGDDEDAEEEIESEEPTE
jgi:hypothetical protein